jgi:hypothetical protein
LPSALYVVVAGVVVVVSGIIVVVIAAPAQNVEGIADSDREVFAARFGQVRGLQDLHRLVDHVAHVGFRQATVSICHLQISPSLWILNYQVFAGREIFDAFALDFIGSVIVLEDVAQKSDRPIFFVCTCW